MSSTSVRQSADQRREAVLNAATEEFAKGGLNGTSTQTIATRAGISQPYLFRLFPNKKALFIAVLERSYKQIVERFEAAVGHLTGDKAMDAMANTYGELIADRTFLLLSLQGFAACDDPEVQAACRRGFRDAWYVIERLSGADPETVRMFYATGMLWNVITAMQLEEVDERWAKLACPITLDGPNVSTLPRS